MESADSGGVRGEGRERAQRREYNAGRRAGGRPLLPLMFLLFFTFLIFTSIPWSADANASGEYGGIWLHEGRELTIGGLPAVWIWMGRSPSDVTKHTLQVDLYDRAPPKQVVLLDGPWVGGRGRMNEFASALQATLGVQGWRLKVQNVSMLPSPGAQGRILILPSGAWPQSLMDNWSAKVGPQDTLIYLGVLEDRVLQEDGSVRVGGVRPELMAQGEASASPLGGQQLNSAGGPMAWRIPRTLNEYEDLNLLARGLVQEATGELTRGRTGRTNVQWEAYDQSAVVMHPAGVMRPAEVRLILKDEKGVWQRMWDFHVPASGGEVDGPAQLNMGQAGAFQVNLQPGVVQTERLSYRAVLFAPNQTKLKEQELGEGSLQPGKAWVGSFTFRNWTCGGDWRVDIEDQFGRSYAGALTHVVEYRLQPLSSEGSVQRLSILRDGKVVEQGHLQLRLQGHADWSDVNVVNGVASFGTGQEGAQTVQVKLDGVEMSYDTPGAQGGPWMQAMRWGLPALLLAGILYFVLKPKGRAIYRIRLHEQTDGERKVVRMGAKEWMRMLRQGAAPYNPQAGGEGWVLRAEEAAEILHKNKSNDRTLMVSLEGAQNLMQELHAREYLGKWREWYGPYEGNEKTRREAVIRRRALVRQLRERMVEGGIKPRLMADGLSLSDPKGQVWQVHEALEEKEMDMAGHLPHALVFADEQEKDKFLHALAHKTGQGAKRIRLALRTGRVKLINASDVIA